MVDHSNLISLETGDKIDKNQVEAKVLNSATNHKATVGVGSESENSAFTLFIKIS